MPLYTCSSISNKGYTCSSISNKDTCSSISNKAYAVVHFLIKAMHVR